MYFKYNNYFTEALTVFLSTVAVAVFEPTVVVATEVSTLPTSLIFDSADSCSISSTEEKSSSDDFSSPDSSTISDSFSNSILSFSSVSVPS